MLRAGDAGAGRPQVPVLGAGPGVPRHRGAHLVARLGVLCPHAGEGPGRRHLSGGTDAAPQARRAAADRAGYRVHRAHGAGRRRGRTDLRAVLPGHRPAGPGGAPGPGSRVLLPRRWGCETVIGHHKTDMGDGQPVLRSKDPAGVEQEMWALFAVYQAICKITGIGAAAAGIPPDTISSRMPWPPRRTPSRLFPPEQADLAFATFLLKILAPGTFTGTARTGRAPARPRNPATSRPANPVSRASPTSSGKSSSTCSART